MEDTAVRSRPSEPIHLYHPRCSSPPFKSPHPRRSSIIFYKKTQLTSAYGPYCRNQNDWHAFRSTTPAPSNLHFDTPKSMQSESLDLDAVFNFDFDMPAVTAGISHDASDLLDALETADAMQTANATFSSSLHSTLGDFNFNGNAESHNELSGILGQLGTVPAPAVTPAPRAVPDAAEVANVFALLNWTRTYSTDATTSSPLESLPMKRKLSETETEDAATKRDRSSAPVAKRPYRRQSAKNTLTLSQLAAAASSGSPLVIEQLEDVEEATKGEEAEVTAAVRLTSTGKPSTARPKAVVPEKYMKNGEAQTITGMTTEQILGYPNWEALMLDVDETHRSSALAFGKMITDNRDKAKWAAKKSRDERKQKVEQLEGQVEELQKKNDGMRQALLNLVRKGVVDIAEIQAYI
ncbi:hypothetical protein CspeluHIS016_0107550 [Cutaneotrichosporon spelunceum]|uniref:BZIP domain-containing protein n=1 Tax=Cutaneotrichosporon spelunceum TaxID=1672016 RepID=A0AAD3TPD4_9TREE|nr:hypothetical protein CspeluHIS016_0107550 [Cutaneotrichosporon spelunceum]